MPAERLIKKYPNRRLYDTSESRYITLEEVREMVLKEIPFKVVDRQSDEDITRNILLQIIMNYGEATRSGFSEYLDTSLRFFSEQQSTIHEQMGKALEATPMDYWMKLGEQNMKIWQDMFNASKESKQED
jgi:polyhydroxyalkanoate synthesis regulator protein